MLCRLLLWRKAGLSFWWNINFPFAFCFSPSIFWCRGDLLHKKLSYLLFFLIYILIALFNIFKSIQVPLARSSTRQNVQEEAYGRPSFSPQCPSMKLSITTTQDEDEAMTGEESCLIHRYRSRTFLLCDLPIDGKLPTKLSAIIRSLSLQTPSKQAPIKLRNRQPQHQISPPSEMHFCPRTH